VLSASVMTFSLFVWRNRLSLYSDERFVQNNNNTSNLNLGFLHLPKCAGTSIESWGLAHGVKWGKYDPSLRGEKKISGCNPWHIPQSLGPKRKSFCVIRDPFDRIISEFRHRACQRKHPLLCDFNTFSQWLNLSLQEPITANDCHLMPQIYYLKFCDYILMYDELQTEFSQLILRHWPTSISLNDTYLDLVVQPRSEAAIASCNRSCYFPKHRLPPHVIDAFDSKYSEDNRAWSTLQLRRRGGEG